MSTDELESVQTHCVKLLGHNFKHRLL